MLSSKCLRVSVCVGNEHAFLDVCCMCDWLRGEYIGWISFMSGSVASDMLLSGSHWRPLVPRVSLMETFNSCNCVDEILSN